MLIKTMGLTVRVSLYLESYNNITFNVLNSNFLFMHM